MYSGLLVIHSLFRWVVLLLLLTAIYRAFTGYRQQRIFSGTDNAIRHWTATVAHLQLITGIILYTKSPMVHYFWSHSTASIPYFEITFFGVVHISVMILAIVLLTIGSAMAKRKPADKEKFKTMLIWFLVALLLIMLAIPWPFSPFANRPYYRTF
jgi:uncharacterized membrane protein YozB (DUF420 family)